MGLLDYLLDVDKRSIQNRRRAEYAVELEQQTAADQRQAVGLAQALAGVGKGPQAPVQQPDGRFKTPMDPDAAAAVRLMQNPGSRGIGNQNAINVMDPAWQQGQTTNQQAIDMNALQIEGQGTLNRIQNIREQQAPVDLALAQQNLKSAQQGYNQQREQFPLIMQQARQALKVQEAQIAASNLSADAKKLTFFNTVRSQYQALPVIKKAAEAQGAYIAASQAALLPSALGSQLALIKMAKISDPESVVREGDVEVIREGYGVLSQLDRALRSSAGQGMTKEMYATYMDALDSMYSPAMDMAAVATKEYQQFETQYKARPGEFTSSVGLDWSLTPGKWKDAPPGQAGKVKKW